MRPRGLDGGIIYGWYCDGQPCKGWGGTTIDEDGDSLNIGSTSKCK